MRFGAFFTREGFSCVRSKGKQGENMIRKRMPLIGIFGSIVLVVALYAPSATPAWATKAPGAPASAQASVRATHGPGAESHATTSAAVEETHNQAAVTSQQAQPRAQS